MNTTGEITLHTNELAPLGVTLLSKSTPPDVAEGAHRDDHYMFILQQQGTFTLEIDFKAITLSGPAICFVAPGQVHRYVKWKNGRNTYFIFVDTSLVNEQYRDIFDTYQHVRQVVNIKKQDILFNTTPLLDQLLNQEHTPLQKPIIHHYLSAILGLIAEKVLQPQPNSHTINSQRYHLAHQFKQHIRHQFKELKQVQQYAGLLNITPLYLNEVVKEITGFPASYWIQQEILLEARRLLYYTVLDVKQIAYELGYEDHAYFSRFFKKNTGITPLSFRDKNHELSNHRQ